MGLADFLNDNVVFPAVSLLPSAWQCRIFENIPSSWDTNQDYQLEIFQAKGQLVPETLKSARGCDAAVWYTRKSAGLEAIAGSAQFLANAAYVGFTGSELFSITISGIAWIASLADAQMRYCISAGRLQQPAGLGGGIAEFFRIQYSALSGKD